MFIENQEVKVLPVDGIQMLKNIELMGRLCYKSENVITEESYKKFIPMILKRGHLSVIEHEKVSVIIRTDRGVVTEILRHRLAAYSNESTRFCNYNCGKFGNAISVIPSNSIINNAKAFELYVNCMQKIEETYNELTNMGIKAEDARDVLPLSLKSDLGVTYNLREWRHVLKIRTAVDAHPKIRIVMNMLLKELKKQVPIVFDDIEEF